MPTYDYLCLKCGTVFEVFHSMSATPEVKCEKCQSLKVERQIGAGGSIVFKGTGFYETDYKKKPSNEVKKDEKKSSEGGAPKKDTGSSNKP